MLRCLPLLKACNQQVDYVDKRHCNLFAVPDDVLRYASTLEELLLDANQIRELPRGLFRLQELRKLTLSDNEICRLPPDVANFAFLQELDVSRNDIEDIPENIKYCKNLQVADFSSNPLQRLPDGFTHLKNLTHLGLNDVSLTRLPADIGGLSSLESLELRENLIKYLPSSLSFLTKLKTLDLGSNLIDELPDTIGSLPSLEELWLDCNEISELPPALGNLKNLTQLDVSENKLEQLPEEISGLTQLTDFILSQNHLEVLPDGIGQLKRLLILKVDQNQLVRLTPNIGNCESLQELLLTENLLAELPPTIGRLKMLTILNVDRNQLSEIPREIGNCTRLSVMSLRDNRIGRLPNELGNLHELHVLDICGNRLQHLPITLGSCSLKAVWLSENQIQPLLKFQTDTDEATGVKVLTCFLLPQQAYQLECFDNLLKDNPSSEPLEADEWAKNAQSSVKFAGEDDGDPFGFEESHFVRHNTPHPKELRARHSGKLTKKDASDTFDGSQHASPPSSCTTENACLPAVPCFDREAHCSNESPSSRGSEVSMGSKASTVKVISEQQTPVEDLLPNSFSGRSHRTVVVKPSTDSPHFAPPVDNSGAEVRFNACPDPHHVDPPQSRLAETTIRDQQQDSTDCAAERHVEFSPEVDNNSSPDGTGSRESVRLQRRDTPHHLKNKRVNATPAVTQVASNGDGVATAATAVQPDATALNAALAGEERVRRILARQIGRFCESFESWTSELPEPVETSDELLDVDRELPPPPSPEELSLTTVDSAAAIRRPLSTTVQKIVRVLREPGVALGMSVAGGLGSTPVVKNSEGIFISRVAEDGPSATAGLRAGDRLISVNGTNVDGMDHQSVVTLLKEAGTSVCLVISREVVPVSEDEAISVTLARDENGLGFTIAGGRGSTPYRGNDQSIYISRITEGGAADRDGRLRVEDKLISVNGIDITIAPHDQAVALLTGIHGEISLVVARDHTTVRPGSVATPDRSPGFRCTQQSSSPPSPPTSEPPAKRHYVGAVGESVGAVSWPTEPLILPVDDGTGYAVESVPILVQPPTPSYFSVSPADAATVDPADVSRTSNVDEAAVVPPADICVAAIDPPPGFDAVPARCQPPEPSCQGFDDQLWFGPIDELDFTRSSSIRDYDTRQQMWPASGLQDMIQQGHLDTLRLL